MGSYTDCHIPLQPSGWSKDLPKSEFRGQCELQYFYPLMFVILTSIPDVGQIGGNTSFPMLIVSNSVGMETAFSSSAPCSDRLS